VNGPNPGTPNPANQPQTNQNQPSHGNIQKHQKPFLIRMIPAFVIASGLIVLTYLMPERGQSATDLVFMSLREMLQVLPPIFILLGLLDVWVPREKMIQYLGANSGLRGIGISFLMGSVAAGPLYAAFPVATILMKKGASFFNVMIFIGAWSTTKVPMFLFELTSMGPAFALSRLLVNIPIIVVMAWILSRLKPQFVEL
jgi:uncharacterized membrane protein YraQ (UPF0718 family)